MNTEQIFKIRIICEEYFQHQQNLCHVFIDVKRHLIGYVMPCSLSGLPCGNTTSNLIRTNEHLNDAAIGAGQVHRRMVQNNS